LIKNIIFDLGVVIIDIIDEENWYQNHLIPLIGKVGLEKAIQSDLFHAIETGTISVNDFWGILQQYAAKNFTLESLAQAWNARLKSISPEKMEQLIALSKNYPLWLLSNTNQIHLDWIKNHIEERFEKPKFDEIFQQQYYSYQLKMKKPEPPIYEFMIQDAAIVPYETVFIDDTLANLKAPAALGIHTIHYQNEVQFQKALQQLLQP
jgi:putative hydrolase of the HAD superfamily